VYLAESSIVATQGRVIVAMQLDSETFTERTTSHKHTQGLDSCAFYASGKNSTDPVIPMILAYPSNNISNLFLMFGGTYNVPSITPSLPTHAPSTNFGLGVVTPT